MPYDMAKALKAWRVLAVMSAAVLTLAIATSAFAQAPPTPPHQFFGSSETGSAAQLDGADAPDGSVVAAWSDGVQVGDSATIENGTWLIQVDPSDASSVTFTIDGSSDPGSFDVTSGSLTEVSLNVTSGAAPSGNGAPSGLPDTGTGGLAGSGSGVPVLPLALVAAVAMALGGVAVTRRSLR